jgi:tetratricopeptide (TPR) repeat protein
MKRILIILVVVILLAAGGVGGTYFYIRNLEEGHFQAGETAREAGDHATAIEAYNLAMATQPDSLRQYDAQSLYGRALAHYGDKNYQATIDDFNTILANDPGKLAEFLPLRVEAYLATRNWEAALADLNSLIAENPEDTALILQRADVHLSLGDETAAKADYETAVTQDPSLVDLRLIFLRDFIAAEQTEAALAEANSILEEDENQPEPYLYRGTLALHFWHFDDAISDLSRATALDPMLTEAGTGLAQAQLLRGDYAQAIETAESILTNQGNNDIALAVLGAARAVQDDPTGIQTLNEAVSVATDADLAAALYYRAWVYLALGETEAALSDAAQIAELAPAWSWGHVLRGDVHVARGEVPQAQFAYQQAVDLDPDLGIVYRGRAAGTLVAGDLAAARADLEQALNLLPNHLPAILLRAEAAATAGETDQALNDLAQALAINAEQTAVYVTRAVIYTSLEDWQAARADYDVVLADDPQNLPALIGRIQAEQALSDHEAVLADLNAAIPLDPRNVDLINQRAITYLDLDDLPAALRDAQRALSLDDDLAMGNLILGLTALEEERYFQAVVALTDAIDLDPELARAFAARGEAQLALDDPDRARADAARAIELDPEYAPAYLVRANVAAREGEWQEALADVDVARDLTPEDTAVYETRGLIYLSSGDANAALDDFNEMVTLDAELVDAHLLRAAALDDLNRYEDAVAALQAALALTLDVDEIELAESTIADLQRIPESIEGLRTWRDAYHGFQVSYPDTWRQFVDPGEEVPLAIVGPLDKDYRANLTMLVLDFGFSPTVRDFARFYDADRNQFDNYELVSDEFVSVDGRSSIRREFTWTASDRRLRDVQVTIIQVYVVDGQRGLLFTAISRSEDLEKYEPIFDDMIASFDLD